METIKRSYPLYHQVSLPYIAVIDPRAAIAVGVESAVIIIAIFLLSYDITRHARGGGKPC
jgi:hypothetical protein